MPNETVRRQTKTAVDLAFAERTVPLARQKSEILFDAARRGAAVSGAVSQKIFQLYESEVAIRGDIILQLYRRAVAVNPVVDGHGPMAEASAFLVPLLEQTVVTLQMDLTSIMEKARGMAVLRTLDAASNHARRRLLHETEMLEAAISAAKSRDASGTHITITGDQNIVQSGSAGATATVILDSSAKTNIGNALKGVHDALAALPEGVMADRSQALEVVREAEVEIAKPEPNKIRLVSILKGVAESVRTVASLKPAYESIKGALAYLGISI